MKFLGDKAFGATIRTSFNSQDPLQVPTTLGDSPAVTVFKDGSATGITTGVTLTVDAGGLVGSHDLTIDTSASADYTAGSDYVVKLTAGTVAGISVAGKTLAEFSIENRSGVKFLAMIMDSVAALGSGGGLNAAGIRAAIGLATANLDAQLEGIGGGSGGAVDEEAIAAATKEAFGLTGTLDAKFAAVPAAVVDEFEVQSQADPTGFQVNVKEMNSGPVRGTGTAGDLWRGG